MLKLATILENPGEPPINSRYHDPQELKSLGYNGLVLYATTALSGLESPDVIASAELRRWVAGQMDHVGRQIEQAHAAGLQVFIFYDVLVLPADLVSRNAGALTCKNRPTTLCPASEEALDLSVRGLQSLLQRWPSVEGVVLRFGDTDASRLLHLVGNDIYTPHCPRCSQVGRADRILAVVERFRQLVVEQCNRRLIVRAWNVRPNGLHDSIDLAKRVISRLGGDPKDDRLILSFKFTQTDFWRYQKWNPGSLLCGQRPVIYELQCQREFEGKGGIPNWQVPLWRDGYPETREDSQPQGLAQVGDKINLAGLWAWVRGGGWGGPFVKNETWIDANVFAVPRLAEDARASADELGRQWIDQRLQVSDSAIASRVLRILQDSPDMIRSAFYIGPYAASRPDGWHPSADWISDDLVDAQAAWRIVQRIPEAQLDALVQEKETAAANLSAHRAELQHLVSDRNHSTLEPLVNTLMYSESLFEMLRDLLAGLVAYRRFQKSRNAAMADLAKQKLFAAQSHWNHHAQRYGSMPGAATSFREIHFWELTQQILSEVVAQ
jgi:hypothetical protein